MEENENGKIRIRTNEKIADFSSNLSAEELRKINLKALGLPEDATDEDIKSAQEFQK